MLQTGFFAFFFVITISFLNLQKTLVTATTTRRKQQQEMILRALRAEEERKRIGRENFPLTAVSVAQLAAYEPALHHVNEEHEEGKLEIRFDFIFFKKIIYNCISSGIWKNLFFFLTQVFQFVWFESFYFYLCKCVFILLKT